MPQVDGICLTKTIFPVNLIDTKGKGEWYPERKVKWPVYPYRGA